MAPTPAVDRDVPFERIPLDATSWVDVARGWVTGAQEVFEHLVTTVAWRQGRLWRYERSVDEPRLGAGFPAGRVPHPVFTEIHRALRDRYGVDLGGVGLAYYRDGHDGQAFHRDRDLRYLDDTLVAVVTFGSRRPWLLRPRDRADKWIAPHGGAVLDLAPAAGDLLVMGGRAQADWEHGVPRVPGATGRLARVSAQWRWTSRRGRPEIGPSYRAPRDFSRR